MKKKTFIICAALLFVVSIAGYCFYISNKKHELKEQLNYEDMMQQVNEFLPISNNYQVGKIFVYTDLNYGEYLEKNNGYVDCTIFAYNLSEDRIIDPDAKIKIRGNSTANMPKKPYNIKFSEKYNLYNFGDSKKWSLLAEYLDPTMLRNSLFLGFAKEMQLEYTSNCKFVEVWLDGKYNGCYLLAESVETGKNRVDIDIENGDFLFEYEAERDEEDVVYITTKHGLRFAMSDPEELDESARNYVQQKMDEFDEAVFSSDYNNLNCVLDVESFAKLYLLNEYAKTLDFGISSVNFYYKEGKFYAGPAWDFDLSSGNVSMTFNEYTNYWESGTVKEFENIKDVSYKGLDNWNSNNKVFSQLYEYNEFKQLVSKLFNQYSEYMQNIYKDSGIIDSMINEYGELILNNFTSKKSGGAGWKFEEKKLNLKPFKTYEQNVSYLKYWLSNRYDFLNEQFNN